MVRRLIVIPDRRNINEYPDLKGAKIIPMTIRE
jgi:hypothetical protein